MNNTLKLAEKLYKEHSLSVDEYERLISERNEETTKYLTEKADELRKSVYGNKVFIRGLIEISSFCKKDCLYCACHKRQ